jgi:hypothetical protein
VAAWTLAWTLFQWWAVVGWPTNVSPLDTAGVLAAVLGLVGLAVWQDVGTAAPVRRERPGRVVTLRLPVSAGARAPAVRRPRRAALDTPPADRRAA